MTILITVLSPTGRDVAAFADPEHAWTWVDEVYELRAYTRYARPDGKTKRHAFTSKNQLIDLAVAE